MPEFSIITPAFNAAKTISHTIESVLAQSFADFELIVINDGSSDRTEKIVREVAETDPRVILLNQKNKGVEPARNAGIKKAKGRFISFLDSDDTWEKDKLADEIEIFKGDQEVSAIYHWVGLLNKKNIKRDVLPKPEEAGDIFHKLLHWNFLMCGSNLSVRKEVIKKIGALDETYNWLGDWDFALRVAKDFRFAYVPKVNVWYRRTRNSMSTKVPLALKDFEHFYEKYGEALSSTKGLEDICRRNFFEYLLSQVFENDNLQRLEYLSCARTCIKEGRLKKNKSCSFVYSYRLKALLFAALGPEKARLVYHTLKTKCGLRFLR